MSTIGSTFNATGIWRGQAEKDGHLVAVRANLREDRGSLRGVMFFGDPGIGGLVDVGSVTGTRSADAGTWQTPSGAAVSGTFSPNDFAGVLQIPRPGSGVVQSALQLRRVPTRLRGFTPIAPGRLLDTRETNSSPPDAGSELYVPVTGKQGIPFRDVGAVVVNITGTEALGPGFVTAWASGTAQPATSNLNLERAGQTAANLAIVPVGSDGYMKLFTQSGSHLVVDAFGWFSTDSILQAPATPTRVLDTRPQYAIGYTGPKPGPGAVVSVSLAGAGGVPSAGVAAAVVNITATEALAPGLSPPGQPAARSRSRRTSTSMPSVRRSPISRSCRSARTARSACSRSRALTSWSTSSDGSPSRPSTPARGFRRGRKAASSATAASNPRSRSQDRPRTAPLPTT